MTSPRGSPRPVLLLAYYYPPLGGIGTQRALSFARHLPELGYPVVVVTTRRGAYGLDPTLGDGRLPGVEVVRADTLEPAVLLRRLRGEQSSEASGDMVYGGRSSGLVGAIRKAVHRTVYFPDHASGWLFPAMRAARRAGREHNVRAVISTSPPVTGHVAALRVARSLGVPAVVDFRDLWTAEQGDRTGGPRAAAERRLERRLLCRAAAVTTVTNRFRTWLLGRYGEGPAKPFHVLRNGFEEQDYASPAPVPEPGVFRIAYTGTLYGDRQDVGPFFRALARVRAAGGFGALTPRMRFAGKIDPQALAAAEAAGCGDLLEVDGFVDHAAAVALQRSATINLLLTWLLPGPVGEGHCPGKMYEQMAAGRPVLALTLPGNEAAEMLRDTGGALIEHPHDEDGIVAALSRLAAAASEGDALDAVPPWTTAVQEYSRRAVAEQLAALLDTVIP